MRFYPLVFGPQASVRDRTSRYFPKLNKPCGLRLPYGRPMADYMRFWPSTGRFCPTWPPSLSIFSRTSRRMATSRWQPSPPRRSIKTLAEHRLGHLSQFSLSKTWSTCLGARTTLLEWLDTYKAASNLPALLTARRQLKFQNGNPPN